MTIAHIDDVLRIEQMSYAFPWTRGNFIDSLAAGYWMQVLRAADGGALTAYVVAMPGVDEMHLLNMTVRPDARRQGIASLLLDALLAECARRRALTLWLEVRPSNAHGLALYTARGFVEQARRTGYYPASRGTREDAIVMVLDVAAVRTAPGDAAADADGTASGNGNGTSNGNVNQES